MKNVIEFPDNRALQDEAALWLAKIDSGEMTGGQYEDLQEWLAGDRRRQEALRDMAALWGQLESLSILAELFPLEPKSPVALTARPSAFAWLRQHALGATAVTLCASVIVAVLLVADLIPKLPWGSGTQTVTYRTSIGQRLTTALKDGSTLVLNTQSLARVRFDKHERAVFLEYGEAHFTVAKNPNVPLVVYAGGGQVRAVGTAFSVRVGTGKRVDVAVSEGKVQLVAGPSTGERASANAARTGTEELHTITISERGVATYRDTIETYAYIDPKQLSQKMAWKSGKWIFEGETLTEVVAEVNRYALHPIEVNDPAIASLRVGGYFDVGDVDSLLATLEQGFGIRIDRSSDGTIRLSATGRGVADIQ